MPNNREFDRLLSKVVPHIHEKIFFSMDYASFKNCLDVSMQWHEMLTSEYFKRKGKYVFHEEMHMEVIEAAEQGNVAKIQQILYNFMIDINHLTAAGPWNDSFLMRAAENGQKDVVQLLLDNGADPNTVGKHSLTALHGAALMGYEDVVKILLKGGAETNTATNSGWTPLLYASKKGNKVVVKLLLDSGAAPNMANYAGSPLHLAIGYTDVVCLLLDRGADSNMADQNGWTPLHKAASIGNIDGVQLLLDRGAQPNVVKQDGVTPLHLATVRGHEDVANMLRENGGTI